MVNVTLFQRKLFDSIGNKYLDLAAYFIKIYIMNSIRTSSKSLGRAFINLRMYSGEPGSGAGKGGGGGGSIREAGGAFGKMEAGREEEYFYRKQKEQLHNLKGHLDKEIAFHQEQIKRHEDAIRRHKEQMATMDKK